MLEGSYKSGKYKQLSFNHGKQGLYVIAFSGGSVACDPLDVWSGGPEFKSSSLPLDGLVFGGTRFNSSMHGK